MNVAYDNAADKTQVELHNAKENIKAGAINTGNELKMNAYLAEKEFERGVEIGS